MRPSSAWMKPARQRSSEVLPVPLGHNNCSSWPAATEKPRPLSRWRSPRQRCSCVTSSKMSLLVVRTAGLEPALPERKADFKSAASTSFATSAWKELPHGALAGIMRHGRARRYLPGNSEPGAQADHDARVADSLPFIALQARGPAEGEFVGEAHIGGEPARDLIAQPQAGLGGCKARPQS